MDGDTDRTAAEETSEASAPSPSAPGGGRYDPGSRRQAQRFGSEKGVRIFVAAEELRAAGIDPDGEPPSYRVWGRSRGSVLVRFYGRG